MRKIYVALIVVFAFALLATGCSAHVTGGGFIDGSDNYPDVTGDFDDKANFGFNFKCDGTDAKGQLTYHDGDLKIKGTFTSCNYFDKYAEGVWVPQGKSDLVGGTFKIFVTDEGEPGVDDTFKIKLWNDGDFLYWNKGSLDGGNIQEH